MAGKDLEEVRYQMLRPAQVIARRQACPVAYLPLGPLEWHGPHNPLGTDGLCAEGLAILCAQKGGGLAFPPLWYGENRLECLVDATAKDRDEIAGAMELPPENFTPARQPFTQVEQSLHYQRLLLHILAEAETLGFELAVFVAGHAPLLDHARAAALLQNQRARNRPGGMLAWAFWETLLVRERYPGLGDHGAGWETSQNLALHPETVDLAVLPPKGGKIVHATGRIPPQEATAAFGRETLAAAAEIAVQEVRHRLAHKKQYLAHGRSLAEGLWREAQVPAPAGRESLDLPPARR